MKAIYAMYGLLMTKYKFIAPNKESKLMNIQQSFGIVLSNNPPIGIHVEAR